MSEFEKSEKMEKEKIGEETALVSPVGCRTGKNTYLRILVVALFMLAAVGFLTSCATSSKSKATTDMDMVDDDEEEDMVDDEEEEDMVDDDEEMMDERGPYQVAVEESNKADEAEDTADKALTEAMELSAKLDGVIDVGGKSGTAMEYAQKVLDAKKTVDQALKDANAALAALEAAKNEADEAATVELNKAIKDVKENIANINKILENDSATESLKAYVEKVTGAPDAEEPTSPASIAMDIAEMIKDALNGIGTADVEVSTSVPATSITMAVQRKNDQPGDTWSEIVGSTNIEEKRIAASEGGGTEVVEAASVDGIAVPVDNSDPPVRLIDCEPDNACDNGKEFPTDNNNLMWFGIAGTFFCEGDDCAIDGDGNFTGGWYFKPSDSKKLYIADTANPGSYKEDTVYVNYGYWLEQNTVPGPVTVQIYAIETTGTNTSGLSLEETEKVKMATYAGPAIGISVIEENDVVRSGEFEARVSLTVDFQDPDDSTNFPSIIGKISDFDGNAANPEWIVNLKEVELSRGASAIDIDDGVTVTNGENGVWSAKAYGDNGEHPTGIFGTFQANFADGNAAGAYATRKVE